MSKRRASKEQPLSVLPGFESTIVAGRPGEQDLTDEKRFTGEVLFRDHPDVFKAVAAAFFLDGLSVRATAARYRVSVNTVRAIRDMALEGSRSDDARRAALFIKSKADRLKGIVRNRALEVLYDRLADPKQSDLISVDTLMKLAQLEEPAKDSPVPASEDVIDIDEFDDMLNGLDAEKNSAASLGVGEGDLVQDSSVGESASETGSDSAADLEEGPGCSTENDSGAPDSFALSADSQYSSGCGDSLCNSVSNSAGPGAPAASSVDASDGRRSAAEGACVRMGGGGHPGAPARGGVN